MWGFPPHVFTDAADSSLSLLWDEGWALVWVCPTNHLCSRTSLQTGSHLRCWPLLEVDVIFEVGDLRVLTALFGLTPFPYRPSRFLSIYDKHGILHQRHNLWNKTKHMKLGMRIAYQLWDFICFCFPTNKKKVCSCFKQNFHFLHLNSSQERSRKNININKVRKVSDRQALVITLNAVVIFTWDNKPRRLIICSDKAATHWRKKEQAGGGKNHVLEDTYVLKSVITSSNKSHHCLTPISTWKSPSFKFSTESKIF